MNGAERRNLGARLGRTLTGTTSARGAWTMNLRVLIADDERLARERLRRLLEAEAGVEIVGECDNGVETLEAVRRRSPDLLFLDIRMPALDGFGVTESLGPNRRPAVVFVSACNRFAVQAFEADAADYLLKPFDRERLVRALQRGRRLVQRWREDQTLQRVSGAIDALAGTPRGVPRFVVKCGNRLVVVRSEEIEWIGSDDNYAELHVGSSVYLLRQTLIGLSQRLSPGQFWRISRSVMVNADQIKEIRPKSHGDYVVVLKNGCRLPGSRNFREPLRDRL